MTNEYELQRPTSLWDQYVQDDLEAFKLQIIDQIGNIESIEDLVAISQQIGALDSEIEGLRQQVITGVASGSMVSEKFVSTEGQQSIPTSYKFAVGAGKTFVYVEGLRQQVGTHYTELDDQTIGFHQPLPAGLHIVIDYYVAISGNPTVITTLEEHEVRILSVEQLLQVQNEILEEHEGRFNIIIDDVKGYTDTQLADYVSAVTYEQSILDIQNQIDGNITTWFYMHAPTLANLPASDWPTTVERNRHLGDVFYDEATGYAYRFAYKDDMYQWIRIEDTDVIKALQDAARAQDTADQKRRTFLMQPIPPYDVGDVWLQGVNGDIMTAIVAKAQGQSYAASDWKIGSKYTDDTRAIEAEANAKAYADEMRIAINGDIDTVYQSVVDLNEEVNTTFRDGVISEAETKSLATYINLLQKEKTDLDGRFNVVYDDVNFPVSPERSNLANIKTEYNLAHTALIDAINTAIADSAATVAEKADVDAKFSDYRLKLAALTEAFERAVRVIENTKAGNAVEQAKGYTDSQLTGYVTAALYDQKLSDIQNQLDGNITTWFYPYTPTLANLPASDWETDDKKAVHLGDIFYNDTNGFAYRFAYKNLTYQWIRIEDTNVVKALADAARAQDTADQKRRVFFNEPVAPYDVGDLWSQGEDGDILVCLVARTEFDFYRLEDWGSASKYTDDTRAIEAEENAKLHADQLIEAVNTDIDEVNTAVEGIRTFSNEAFADGIVTRAEKEALRVQLEQLANEKEDVDKRFTSISNDALLKESPLTNLESAKANFDTKFMSLVEAIEIAVADDTITDSERADVSLGFFEYRESVGLLSTRFEEAVRYIESRRVESVTLGGRNLLLGTSQVLQALDTGLTYHEIPEGNREPLAVYNLLNGETLTYRLFLKVLNNVGAKAVISAFTSTGLETKVYGDVIANEGYSKVTYTIPQNTVEVAFGIHTDEEGVQNALVEYKEAKVEKGSFPSSWSYAPEDIDIFLAGKVDQSLIDEVMNDIVYKIELNSSRGFTFKNGYIETVITASIYRGMDNITSTLPNTAFIWRKYDKDGVLDTTWTNEHVNIGNVISIDSDDVYQKAVFTCEVQI